MIAFEQNVTPHLIRAMSMPLLFKKADPKPMSFNIQSPTIESKWHHGKPAIIQWDPINQTIAEIQILILRTSNSKEFSIVADHVENNGLYVLGHVPRHLSIGNDYFLRIQSMDGVFCIDTATFSIEN